jgi:substrate import-associated zinc metallohydrolase lipoprotein
MKKNNHISYLNILPFGKAWLGFLVALAAMTLASCTADDPDEGKSVIVTPNEEQTDFDKWLEANFAVPYNIDFKYRYKETESDYDYYTVPARYEDAVKMAHLVKYLCVETYDEVAGTDFTRRYFPKMFFLIGEWEYRNNGTYILGTAEGGRKILLAGLNYLTENIEKGPEYMNFYYFKTIHHEFTHIMNQTKIIPADFQLVSGKYYLGDMWSEEPYDKEYPQRGFISAYAQNSYEEDFAEMLSEYITHDAETWINYLKDADKAAVEKPAKTDGETIKPSEVLNTKLDIVRRYMKESFNIDIDVLRETVQRRQADIVSGKVDLTDITVK